MRELVMFAFADAAFELLSAVEVQPTDDKMIPETARVSNKFINFSIPYSFTQVTTGSLPKDNNLSLASQTSLSERLRRIQK